MEVCFHFLRIFQTKKGDFIKCELKGAMGGKADCKQNGGFFARHIKANKPPKGEARHIDKTHIKSNVK